MDKKQPPVISTSSVTDTVINKPHLQLNNQQAQFQLQKASSGQDNVDDFKQPVHLSQPSPKITVSLPEHAASKLRDLVQRRDIALIRLGIVSVQFDNDQIIPLTLSTTAANSANQSAFTNLPSPGDSILEDETLNSNRQILDSSISVATTSATPAMSHAPIIVTTAAQQTDCNNMSVVYGDDDDGKDEEEVANEVENHNSGYSIQLSQLEFTDTIDLEMYDNENLLFPDYTLNLS